MSKWADYCISEVRYDSNNKHIDKVKVHEDKGDKMGSASEWSRAAVVTSIEDKKTFVTITKNSEGNWKKGAEVGIIHVNLKKYLRTDRDKTESDNLGKLPTF